MSYYHCTKCGELKKWYAIVGWLCPKCEED